MSSPLYSTAAVARILGLHPDRVRRLAQSRGVGQRAIGSSPAGPWLFSEADIDAMRIRTPGRPRKEPGK